MSAEDASALLHLQSLWHDRYNVDVADGGTWSASRQGAIDQVIKAESGQQLRHKISEDYAAWQAQARRRA